MENLVITKDEVDAIFSDAWVQAHHSECLKKRVGAVLVDMSDQSIIGWGFGGPKTPCKECVRKKYDWQQDGCWSIHSEMRAIFNAMDSEGWGPRELAERGKDLVMFVTHGPCDQCLKLMGLFNIPLCIYDTEYHNDYSKWEGKVRVIHRGTGDIILSE